MKKTAKSLSVMALCVLMLVMSVVPAFAATNVTYTEDHSVIDCSNRYKDGTSDFHFTIKVPSGYSISNVTVKVTSDYNGTVVATKSLSSFSNVSYSYSYDGSDYYELVTDKYATAGIGVKLYCYYNGSYYMATDTSNYSTTEGRGYWLSA